MNRQNSTYTFQIIFSVILAFALSIIPLPVSLQWWQPAWLLLVIMFWMFVQPSALGLFSIWLMGLYLDLLSSDPIGQHAIPLLVIAYLLFKFQARWRIFPFIRQFLVIFILILIYYLGQYEIVRLIYPLEWRLNLFYPIISTSLLWIVVFKLLKNYENQLKKW